ncbi:MAG: hypothetical protein AAF652_19390 [Cyanobacteria bacterium P01_C01_bin.72]
MNKKQWVGIDVCQKYLDIYVRPSGKLFQVTNDKVGIGSLVQTLKKIQPELIVLEGSAYAQTAARRLGSESFCGGMEIDVTVKLTTAELAVAVINPRQAQRGRADRCLLKSVDINEHIEWLEKRLQEIESQIQSAIAVNPDWQQKMDLLTSVPGVGEVVAVTLISSLPELGTISHMRSGIL